MKLPHEHSFANLCTMAGYLSCITVGGGVPMFTRRVGDLKAVSN